MRRKSIWEGKSPDVSDFPQLVGNNESDIIIIGGGITGLTTALLLYEKGYSVSLLEAGKIAGGTTGLSSCHLNTDIDEEYRNITENFDLETAAAVAESRRSAIDFIEKITIEKNISCDFKRVPGYLYSEIPEDVTIIKEEFAYASKAGLDVSLHDSAPLPFPTKKALRFENQAEFNSVKYLQGLASYIKGKVNIYENSQVVDMHEENGHYFLKTAEGMIKASRVVMATHLPLFFNLIQTISAP
jgi:glycine/D-amino acid oxidase-like deaminating enzyme